MMRTTLKAIIGMIVLALILPTVNAGTIDYGFDIYNKAAPYLSMIDPTRDQATVTAPIGLKDSPLTFQNVFGRPYITYQHVTLAPGEKRTFDVPLPDMGDVGLGMDFYNDPSKMEVDGIPAIGSHHDTDYAGWSVVSYLSASKHDNKIYVLGGNGVWGWVDRPGPKISAATAFLNAKEFVAMA